MIGISPEIVDIYQYPTRIAEPSPLPIQLALGDLHANAIKFIYFLIREGVLTIGRNDFAELVEIYKTPTENLSAEKLAAFNNIIARAKATSSPHHIIFIGDDLADRGMNDYFILKIYEKLSLSNINFEVLISNHTSQFLNQFFHGLENENQTLYINKYASFGTSLSNLQTLIVEKKIDSNEIFHILHSHYLPKLTLWVLDFSTSPEGKLFFNIYSHAPVDIVKITNVGKYFGIEIPSNQLLDLYTAMSSISMAFKNNMFKENGYNSLFLGSLNTNDVIGELTNDRYEDLRHINELFPYLILNIHGHVGTESFQHNGAFNWFYVNLDSNLGKKINSNQGEYVVLTNNFNYSSPQLMPAATPSELLNSQDSQSDNEADQENVSDAEKSEKENESNHHSEEEIDLSLDNLFLEDNQSQYHSSFFSKRKPEEPNDDTTIPPHTPKPPPHR